MYILILNPAETNGTTEAKAIAHVGIPISKPPQPQGKNPVMILNEIRPGTQYDFVSESRDHLLKNFTMQVCKQEAVDIQIAFLFIIRGH